MLFMMNTIDNKLINDFLVFLDKELNYSKDTIKNYKFDIVSFFNYLEVVKKSYLTLSKDDVRNYLKNLDEKNLSSKTISRRLSSLRTFYNFLVDVQVVEKNSFEFISNPKLEKKLPNFLNNNEVEDLFNSFEKNNFYETRNYLLLELIYSCGLRLSEVLNIKLKDINYSDRLIKIIGKGKKTRMVCFGDYVFDALNLYINKYRSNFVLSSDEGYLLISKYGTKLSKSGANKIIKISLLKSGINHSASAHSLRHTFATDLLNEGASIDTVKELLGHSSLATTQIYTHVTSEKIKNTYLNAHPRSERNKDK